MVKSAITICKHLHHTIFTYIVCMEICKIVLCLFTLTIVQNMELLVPILSPFLGSILRILTHVLLLFSVFCTMQLTIQASGMNKFKVYINFVYYHHFMVSMIKIGMIWSAFAILIHVYYCL